MSHLRGEIFLQLHKSIIINVKLRMLLVQRVELFLRTVLFNSLVPFAVKTMGFADDAKFSILAST